MTHKDYRITARGSQEAMSASRMPIWDGQLVRSALRRIRRIVGWAVGVMAIVTVITFATAGTSKACRGQDGAAQQIAQQSAASRSVKPQTGVHNAAKELRAASDIRCVAAEPSPASSAHSPGAGSCCSACTAAMTVAAIFVTRSFDAHLVGLPRQIFLPLIESEAQFRPPRATL